MVKNDNRLKELRLKHGYTLDDIESKTGIKRGTYSNYENHNTEPKIETWQKLADFFGVSVPYLQGIEPEVSPENMIKKIIPKLHKEYFDNYLLLNGELPRGTFSINPYTTTTLDELIKVNGEKKKPIDFYFKNDKEFKINPKIEKYWFNLLLPFAKDICNSTWWLYDNNISVNTFIHFIDMKLVDRKPDKISILESYLIDCHYFAFDVPLHHLMNTSIKYSDFKTAKKDFYKYFDFLKEVRDKIFSKSETEILKKAFESRLKMEERYDDEELIQKIKKQVNDGDTKLARFLVENPSNWHTAYKEYSTK